MLHYDINTLRQYESDGWIKSQVHPTLPLIVWNYTQFTQYEAYWDDITLNCRGLVTDTQGNVVAKGFPKFFNYSEKRTNIPEKIKSVKVYDKLDGSYIGLFHYENQWVVYSKGSFTSEQVFMAEEIIKRKSLKYLSQSMTYCFELIHPQNRIVCDYGDKTELVFLAAFQGGVEVKSLNTIYGFESVESEVFNFFDYELLKSKELYNKEGYVIRFENGERCKIKFDEYLRLHRIITNTTSYDIYECLKNGDDFEEILSNIPDEFYNWVRKIEYELINKFNEFSGNVIEIYNNVVDEIGDDFDDTKKFALYVMKHYKEYSGFMFKLRNGQDIEQMIWKEIKPKFEKPFSSVTDEV